MNCTDINDLLPGYAAGALNDSEREVVDQHLESGCEPCRHELSELAEAASMLALDEPPVAPPAELKRELLARIAADAQKAPSQKAPSQKAPSHKAPSHKATPASLDATAYRRSVGPRSLEARADGSINGAPTSGMQRWAAYLPYVAATLVAVALGSFAAKYSSQNGVAPSSEDIASEWRQRIDQTERTLGARSANLVRLQPDAAEGSPVTNLVFDELTSQLHLQYANTTVTPPGVLRWVWLLDGEGQPLAKAPLTRLDEHYSSAILDLTKPATQIALLLVTDETDEAPAAPSERVVDRITLSHLQ